MKPKLPRTPYFEQLPGQERWNYIVPGYAVVGRVQKSTSPNHVGEYFWVTSDAEGQVDGYEPTLREAQLKVADFVFKAFEIGTPTQTYNGA